ncbi:MAG: hypothetical protein K8T90_21810 [Planctomycetes bacterium]|nr:hypothetical protein [Planctomycetota bacterium]
MRLRAFRQNVATAADAAKLTRMLRARPLLLIALGVATGCATAAPPHRPSVVAAPPSPEPVASTPGFEGISDRFAAADAQLAAIRKRASWPSVADRERWSVALAAADEARERTAVDPQSLGAFESRVAALLQMDRIFVVGEMARRQR